MREVVSSTPAGPTLRVFKGGLRRKNTIYKKSQILEETPPKCCIRFSNNEFNLLSPTFQCYYVEILVFRSIRHYCYVACILSRESLERRLMTSLTQHIALCYLSKQWKTCQKAKLRLLSIMIYRLRNYRLTSKKYSESLTCDYEDLDSWLLRKKQPHIDEKELKRKNKRNASRSFESTDTRWYVGVVILSVYYCCLHL